MSYYALLPVLLQTLGTACLLTFSLNPLPPLALCPHSHLPCIPHSCAHPPPLPPRLAIFSARCQLPRCVVVDAGSGYCKYGWSEQLRPSGTVPTFLVSRLWVLDTSGYSGSRISRVSHEGHCPRSPLHPCTPATAPKVCSSPQVLSAQQENALSFFLAVIQRALKVRPQIAVLSCLGIASVIRSSLPST